VALLKKAFRLARAATPRPMKRALDQGFEAILRRLPLEARLKLAYLKCHQRWPNFRAPTRFTELCQTLKLSRPDLRRFVDKIAVKDFVGGRIGEQHLIPTLYAGSSLPLVRDWPLPFVIKASHGSGGNIFVRENPDWPLIERQLAAFLAFDYSLASGETFYSDIPPRVLVEPLMGDGDTLPVDYKIFTFGGVPEIVQVDTDRECAHKRAYFDTDWNRVEIHCLYPDEPGAIERPRKLDEMLQIAAVLGRGFPFVRVDLYEIDGAIFFGELTFCPEAGMARIEPASVDLEWGRLWRGAVTS
jgi:hypothetical protein